MPRIQDDFEFLKSEANKGVCFLRDYCQEKINDERKGYMTSIKSQSPFDIVRFLLIFVLTALITVTFDLWRNEIWPVVGIIFLVLFDVIFQKEWLAPVWGWLWEFSKTAFSGLFHMAKVIVIELYEIAISILVGIKDIMADMVGSKK